MGVKKSNPGSKSEQAKAQSAARKAAQQDRGSTKFKSGSNKHHGAAISNSGTPKK